MTPLEEMTRHARDLQIQVRRHRDALAVLKAHAELGPVDADTLRATIAGHGL